MNVVAVIQARMTSTRLPGKVLMDIAGRPALDLMLSRVSRAKRLLKIVVATTLNETDDPVVALCDQIGIASFRGSEPDVLGRVHEAALAHSADFVVRLTADCPIHDPAIIDKAVTAILQSDFDYVSNITTRTYPVGLDVEVMKIGVLSHANDAAEHPTLREHVTPYISRRRPNLGYGEFKLGEILFDADFSHLRWTVDTPEDLARVRAIASGLEDGFTWLEALAKVTREPKILSL